VRDRRPGCRVAQEWWGQEQLSEITFEDGVAGWRARLRNGPDVWEIILVRRADEDDEASFLEHFEFVPAVAPRQALEYGRRLPDEIQAMIDHNQRIEALISVARSCHSALCSISM
jgi:hypothetical protein